MTLEMRRTLKHALSSPSNVSPIVLECLSQGPHNNSAEAKVMSELRGYFDLLHFTESVLGTPHVEGGSLIVPVSGIYLIQGHPLQDRGFGPFSGELVFPGAVSSQRNVLEYIGDSRNPQGFKRPYVARDDLLKQSDSTMARQEFGFEGYQREPSAWIDDWVVKSNSFEFRVSDIRDLQGLLRPD